LFGTLKVQCFILTEVRDCDLLIVVTSSTFVKRKDMFKEQSFHKTFSGRNHSVHNRVLSQWSFIQCLLPDPSAILCCISAQTLSPATTCSRYSLYQVWQPWAYSLVFVQRACWHTDDSTWSVGQLWQLSQFQHRKHCWCAHMSLPEKNQCSHHVVLVPFCIIYSLHLIAVWFLQAIWLLEWSLQLPSFLAFYVSKGRAGPFKYFPKNALLSFCHIVAWVCSFASKHLQASLHVLAPYFVLPLSVLHPSRYYQMSNDDLDELLSLPRGTVFPTWRLHNSSSIKGAKLLFIV